MERIATVKDDGTVEVEMEGHNLVCEPEVDMDLVCEPEVDTGTADVTGDPAEDIPPLQIVMLIVGTRGDVQPFIAIGKRLQVITFLRNSDIYFGFGTNTFFCSYT